MSMICPFITSAPPRRSILFVRDVRRTELAWSRAWLARSRASFQTRDALRERIEIAEAEHVAPPLAVDRRGYTARVDAAAVDRARDVRHRADDHTIRDLDRTVAGDADTARE